jgi:hypothetical protein
MAVAWFAVAIASVATALRHPSYINSLPPSPANRALAVGVWNLLA